MKICGVIRKSARQYLLRLPVFGIAILTLAATDTAFCETEKSNDSPKSRVELYDSLTGRGPTALIYPDKSGEPALDSRPTTYAEHRALSADGKPISCPGELFENYSSPYSAETTPFVFAEQKIAGQNYVKVKFCNQWAWFTVPDNASIQELTKEEVFCYDLRREEANEQLTEAVVLTKDRQVTFYEEFSASNGRWEKRVELPKPGIFRASRPKGAPPSLITIGAESRSTSEKEIIYGVSKVIEHEQPLEVLLAPGVYLLRLEENVEEADYLPPCPPSEFRLSIALSELSGPTKDAAEGVTVDEQQPLKISEKPQLHRALLTALTPGFTFTTELNSLGLITIDDVELGEGAYLKVEYGRSEGKEVTDTPQRILTNAGRVKILVGSRKEELPPTSALPVSFSVSALLGNPKSSALFQATPASGLIFHDESLRLQNVSGLDLRDVELRFDSQISNQHRKDLKHIAVWPKDEVQTFAFESTLAARSFEPFIPRLRVLSASGTTAIALELANFRYDDTAGSFSRSPSTEYDEKIKFKVWQYCAKRDPSYQESFQRCQELWLKEEFTCRRLHDPRHQTFIDCVRKGLAENFPE